MVVKSVLEERGGLGRPSASCRQFQREAICQLGEDVQT